MAQEPTQTFEFTFGQSIQVSVSALGQTSGCAFSPCVLLRPSQKTLEGWVLSDFSGPHTLRDKINWSRTLQIFACLILVTVIPGCDKCSLGAREERDWTFVGPTLFMVFKMFESMSVLVAHSCPTLCNPMDCSLPDSPVHGILQARTLEWVGIPFSRRSSWLRDWTYVSCIAGRFFTIWATREARSLLFSYLRCKDNFGCTFT